MRIHRRAITALVLVAALIGTLTPSMPTIAESPSETTPTPPQPSGARLLSSTESGLTFSVAVPWKELRLEPVTVDGEDYVKISLPNSLPSAEPGAPALPIVAVSIGVPFGAAVTVHVEPSGAHTIALAGPPLPAATQTLEWQPPTPADGSEALPATTLSVAADPAFYGGVTAYPASLAEITSDGIMRQQRVAGLTVHPVRYTPATQQLTVYESLKVTVKFSEVAGRESASRLAAPESAAYEELLARTLLNYTSARQWRRSVEPSVTASLAETDAEAATPWTPPSPGWRIKVRADGFYTLAYAALATAGLPVGVGTGKLDPATLKLYAMGTEVAVEEVGDGDIYFEDGEYLQFFGEAPHSKYAAANVYWLTYGGTAGLRMLARSGDPQGAEAPATFQALRHLETNRYYISVPPGDETLDRWFWSYVYPTTPNVAASWSTTFSLAEPYTAPATLTLQLVGQLDDRYTSPDHHIIASLNGTQLGEALWNGFTWRTMVLDVPQGLLRTGVNTVTVTAPNDLSVGIDLVYTDWIELEYASGFTAAANALPFDYETSGTWTFRPKGFTTDQIAVYDVTDPWGVEIINDVEITGANPYTATFQDTLTAPARYWAAATTTFTTIPATDIEADTPSDLQSASRGADYVLVTHSAFAAQAETLRAHRAGQGLRAVTVDVQDIYDEFGYGLTSAPAIHDFLAYAYQNWVDPAPSYVVLLGDGHYDPKAYYYTRTSFIPPYLAPVDPWITETASDNRFVTLVGADTLPDMMLGRLSVNFTTEAAAYISKIIAYEASPVAAWQQQVLAVADDYDPFAGNFPLISSSLIAAYLPAPFVATEVYYPTGTDPVVTRAAIVANINSGKLLVNYIGHAGYTRWADEAIFRTTDVATLTNAGMYPVVLAMTCREGYFHSPLPLANNQEALGEVVTRADGKGAVASWSPTGLGVADGHDFLNRGFFEAFFTDGVRTLGEATLAGKLELWATGSNLDLLDTFLLFGDPATTSLVPEPPEADLTVTKAVSPTGVVNPGDVLTYTLSFANLGPDAAPDVVLTDWIPGQLRNLEVVSADGGAILRPGTLFTWDIASLAAGAEGTVVIRATVDPELPAPALIVNSVSIDSGARDLVSTNNSDLVYTDVEPSEATADLEVVKTVEPTGSVSPGAVLTYTLTFANVGPDPATYVILYDPLPAELLDPEIITTTGDAVLRTEDFFTWDIASLDPGASGTIVLRATVDPALEAPATIENSAVISALEVDPEPVNNTASVSTNVVVAGQIADLAVAKNVSHAAGPVLPGATLTYTITFGNLGPDAASAVVLSDLLPAGLIDAQVVSSSGGAVLQPGTTFTWSIASLASGAGGTIVFRATVDPGLAEPTSLMNAVVITGAEPDPATANNSASVTTIVHAALYLPLLGTD